jgi:hypothetical protein
MPLYWLIYQHNSQVSIVIDLPTPSFTLAYGRQLMDWTRASSPRATRLIASGR